MRRSRSFTAAVPVLAVALLFVAGCGDDGQAEAQGERPPATFAPPPTTVPPSSSSPNTSTTTAPGAAVPQSELDEATAKVTAFVDSLGRGDLDTAAATVGPVSEQHAEAAGGLRSMLQQSTEGHGSWLGAADRTVTAIGVDRGLVVVLLEGTVSVEGEREHRVAAFPVRKAESANAWFVEPWAYAIASTPPLLVRSPEVDGADEARVPLEAPVSVTFETALAGRVWVSFDDHSPSATTVEPGPRSTTVSGAARDRVMVLFQSDATLYALAFGLIDDDVPSPTVPTTTRASSPIVSVPFLPEATNQLLRSCAAGNDASCDGAQVPGVLDDGAFSYFHRLCSSGDRTYCVLLDHLVEAERRLHAQEGK